MVAGHEELKDVKTLDVAFAHICRLNLLWDTTVNKLHGLEFEAFIIANVRDE